jgi:cellulose synthase/poly-beta-1,6-N-acetylglucosamine synthase-like glycosyltransferase
MKEITITLTRYKEPNRLLFATLFSLAQQKNITATVLMLDQQDDKETAAYCAQLSTPHVSFVRKKIEAVGLSFARNQAITLCNTDILLCIDADALADEQRAYELTKTFAYDDRIALVGGKILPKFHAPPPFLLQLNFVYDMYSLLDRGDEVAPFSKVV